MKVCVVGLWHLGSVTAACLSSGGHQVYGLDFDAQVIDGLSQGKAPLFEPGLDDLIQKGIQAQTIHFTTDPEIAARDAAIIWLTYDTPVDEDDRADVDYVIERMSRLFPYLKDGQEVLISSQLPAGSCRRLQEMFEKAYPNQKAIGFSCSPENLRLGKAISVFTQPDRVVIGTRTEKSQVVFKELLSPFTDRIEWMGVESAEMTKHALNAFLATSVTFINEIAVLCEQVGADAKEVERGLKTEARIGPKAYLGPGGAFAGGTLARDIAFLSQLGEQYQQPIHIFPAVKASNDAHKLWHLRHLEKLLGGVRGKTIAVWGLTYKSGTNTLRRSSAIELCQSLLAQGAKVQAHDPSLTTLPEEFSKIQLCASVDASAQNADALVIATEWPDYKNVELNETLKKMNNLLVLDANRFLVREISGVTVEGVKYITIGKSS